MGYDLWYKNAIIYSLDVGRYMDGNGDGEGDFEGLIQRLDYLVGLGVTTLWLLPFFPSPNRDDGYDVTDYFGVDPKHGTLGDFVEFMHQARDRGLRVVLDLVVNHTSDQHPWFQAARRGEQPFVDYYYWSDTEPPNARQGMVFPGVQETTWTRDPVSGRYYYHRFMPFQPDLKTENPAVHQHIQRIMGFWLALGVSGFRVDAVPFLIENMDQPSSDDLRFEFLRDIRSFLQWRAGNAVLLAEANVPPEDAAKFFGDDCDRMHMLFNFPVNQRLFYALATGDLEPLRWALEATRDVPQAAQYAMFLRNHDELDLGRLTEEQRQRVFSALGPDASHQLYGRGIRRRLAAMLGGDRRRHELALGLLFGLPGTPVIYYGDELGMGDDLSQPDRRAVRTAMQWNGGPNGGFTSSNNPQPAIIRDGQFGYETLNVAAQLTRPDSFLNVTERLIRARKRCREIGWGNYRLLTSEDPGVLAILYEHDGHQVLVIYNFRDQPTQFAIAKAFPGRQHIQNMLPEEHGAQLDNGQLSLEPYGYGWYKLEAPPNG